jgi:hypothetical protein
VGPAPHTQPIGHLGAVAAGGDPFAADADGLRIQLTAVRRPPDVG